jgi:uncharacterized protein (DUF302 family)
MAEEPSAIVERSSSHDVARAVELLSGAAAERGMEVFAVIDHAAAARAAGLELPDEVLVVFGAPKVGTALMTADARAGLDLPLRVLVWDDSGQTRMAYREPGALGAVHSLGGLDEALAKMTAALEQVVAAAA